MSQSHQLAFISRQFDKCTFQCETILRRHSAYRRQNQCIINTNRGIFFADGKQLEASIPKNRIKPWIKLARCVEPFERLIGIEKCILHSIESLLTVGKNSHSMCQRLGLVALDNVAKGVPIARLTSVDDN